MNKKYTIKDIALLAGVSKGTVDRVLHKRGKVSEKALEKINKVLDEIDYEPNLIARNLKNNKFYHICVILPDPTIDKYWFPCIKGIEKASKKFKAYNLAVDTYYFDPESTESFLSVNETVLNLAPDAVLLAPLFYKEALNVVNNYNTSGIIVNIFNNQVQAAGIKSFVGQDLFRSGRVAAKLMDLVINNGQIAIIHLDETYENAVHMQEKERGFRDYFSEKENLVHKITTLNLKDPNVENSLTSFLNETPNLSGIFVTNSKAFKIAKVISATNLKIAIIGYDLMDENVNYLNQGKIDFLIHQNQKRQVYLGISSLVEHFLFDKEISDTNLLPIDIVTSENADFYMP